MIGYHRLTLLVLGFVSAFSLSAQQCELVLSGQIVDKGSSEPLSFAKVILEGSGSGQICDQQGRFRLTNLCPGDYHLIISHISCEPEQVFFTIRRDTTVLLELEHHEELLNEVVIHDEVGPSGTQSSQTFTNELISRQANETLGQLLDQMTGVTSLNTGTGVAKPIIQGMYGNRITILNNGIKQAGQQWGNDHAPEIDPLAADHISVIKGVGALAYPGSSLGGIVLVEPGPVSDDPHLHGAVNYLYETNGKGHSANVRLEQQGKAVGWRVTGTWKKAGDRHSPDYFLTNTGVREANGSFQLDKSFSDKWKSQLYYSIFTTEIGILRGSHIGNLTDLESAISKTNAPFFTQDTFSYQINAPSQLVGHHLLKWSNQVILADNKLLSLTYSGQLNSRKEFDVRRSGRSEIPAMSLRQITNFAEAVYTQSNDNGSSIKTGIQATIEDNTNLPETGILPLIPDYFAYDGAAFLLYAQEWQRLQMELGGRYQLNQFEVAAISRDLPRIIERYSNTYHNLNATAGLRTALSKTLSLSVNSGYVSRNPAINELYSFGLHQGVSGIEEGDPDLESERSIKSTLSIDWKVGTTFFLQILGYHQSIQEYIYLLPQDEFRLTIRGAFPVFRYTQTDARFVGVDFMSVWEPERHLKFTVQGSWIRGDDLSSEEPLIFVPPPSGSGTVSWTLDPWKGIENASLSLSAQHVMEQTRFNEALDFLDPPAAYTLVKASLSAAKQVGEVRINGFVRGENLLNTSYRSYLNRQRYFADEMGRSVIIGVNVGF